MISPLGFSITERFALQHCFHEPSAEAIHNLCVTAGLSRQGVCLTNVGRPGRPCTHTLCGRGVSRDPRVIKDECESIVSSLLRSALKPEMCSLKMYMAEHSRTWIIRWRGGPGAASVRSALDEAGLSMGHVSVVLYRKPLVREIRAATRRFGKFLGVSLPYVNDYRYLDVETREAPVILGAWSRFKVGDSTLEHWVEEIANMERDYSTIPDNAIQQGLLLSNAEERAFAFLLLGASAKPKRRSSPRRLARIGGAVSATNGSALNVGKQQ